MPRGAGAHKKVTHQKRTKKRSKELHKIIEEKKQRAKDKISWKEGEKKSSGC